MNHICNCVSVAVIAEQRRVLTKLGIQLSSVISKLLNKENEKVEVECTIQKGNGSVSKFVSSGSHRTTNSAESGSPVLREATVRSSPTSQPCGGRRFR